MNEKLRGKLAEWAGFQWLEATDGNYHWFDANGDIVSPTDEDGNVIWDMNACIEHLVPQHKIPIVGVHFRYFPGGTGCKITYMTEPGFDTMSSWVQAESKQADYNGEAFRLSALALCLAIEKLIDGEK